MFNLAINWSISTWQPLGWLKNNQAQLRGSEEKDSNLVRLQPILAEAQLADQETHRIKVNHIVDGHDNADCWNNWTYRRSYLQLLWEPYLKMNASMFPFPDNVVDLPKVLWMFHVIFLIYLKSVTCQVFNICRLQPRDRRWWFGKQKVPLTILSHFKSSSTRFLLEV